MKKFSLYSVTIFLIILLGYSVGPRVSNIVLTPEMPSLGISIDQVENFIEEKESVLQLKPDNGGRVIWMNGESQQTEYCLLYLHGFGASWFEGSPINVDFARRYGMNAYFPLMDFNGIESEDPLVDMTAEGLYESAKEALVITHLLGKKVIIMSTSTGGTLSLKLAAEHPDLVDGLILYSPNVRIKQSGAFLLDKPWGLQIARLIEGDVYHRPFFNPTLLECQYWDCKYRLEAVVALQQLIGKTMRIELFERVKAPVFMAYYYKDRENQDDMVSVDALIWMFDNLGTVMEQKEKMSFPNAGTHRIGSGLVSGAWKEVEMASFNFAESKLGLVPEI